MKNYFDKSNKQLLYGKTFYRIIGPLLVLLSRFRYRFKKDCNVNWEKGPYLILANHCAFEDFILVGSAVYPRYCNFVVAEKMAYKKSNKWFIDNLRAITRHQYASDIASIKRIKQNLDSGINVVLFPEGKMSVDGVTGYIMPSTAKLIKFLKYPVVTAKISGASIYSPRWNKKAHRRGKVKMDMSLLLSTDEVKSLPQSEIYSKITQVLAHNDYEYQQLMGLKINPQKTFTRGLEKLLYKCPVCGTEFKLASKEGGMKCQACGSEFIYGKNGQIMGATPQTDRVDKWFDYERDSVISELKNGSFTLSEEVVALAYNEKDVALKPVGVGTLSFTADGVSYVGEIRGEHSELFITSKELPLVSYVVGDSIDIYIKEVYRFVFTGIPVSTKFALAVEENYKLLYSNENSL